ncbi:unnamed protein product [Caenorhabditis angaria]|uniref:RING-type E3 ubiquitin transferase BRCA1 n=1 Tax=Caenorhabditis angaria TaxID=860376 RepID=A0A9P1MY48_9PELO|nr:unnamed protein product [Caenorhabditis angaria]
MNEYAMLVVETLSRLQKEVRCGICCSTYSDPVITTCQHSFCRKCLELCFEKKRKLFCPICRSVLDKRSCKDSYQLTIAVQNYLKLAEAYARDKDIAETQSFAAIPKELAFCESQRPMDITIIPENDGKRVAPDFIIPALPTRTRKKSGAAASRTSLGASSVPQALIDPPPILAPPGPSRPAAPRAPEPPKTNSVSTQADLDLAHVNITEEIRKIPATDEISALFQLLPSLEVVLARNFEILARKFGGKENNLTAGRKVLAEKVAPQVCSAEPENLEKPAENEDDEEEEIVEDSNPEQLEILEPVKNEHVVAAQVEEEEEGENTLHIDVTSLSSCVNEDVSRRRSDWDGTMQAIQNEQDRIDLELSNPPKVIACSRISNNQDEELLADFHAKFLSNSCRFSDDVDEKTTHLVMMNSEGRSIPQKSLLYTFAVARGCIILNRNWIEDCVKMCTIVDENDYTILECPESLEDFGARKTRGDKILGWQKSREIQLKMRPKLFTDFKFMIIRRFAASPYVDYKKLIDLVKIGGGEIFENFGADAPKNLIIIFSKTSQSIGEFEKMEKLYRCPVVTIEWLLDSISEYTMLPYSEYLVKKQI